MKQLPDLSTLSHAEKDHLIHALFDALVALRQDVAALQAENATLQAEV
jgi:ribosomal protein L29